MNLASIEHVEPAKLKKFVKRICVASALYHEKHQAKCALDEHLEKIRDNAQEAVSPIAIIELKSRVSRLIEAENRLRQRRLQSKNEVEVTKRNQELEKDLEETRLALNHEAQKNKRKIKELTKAVVALKGNIEEIMGKKHKKLKGLEEKVGKKP